MRPQRPCSHLLQVKATRLLPSESQQKRLLARPGSRQGWEIRKLHLSLAKLPLYRATTTAAGERFPVTIDVRKMQVSGHDEHMFQKILPQE